MAHILGWMAMVLSIVVALVLAIVGIWTNDFRWGATAIMFGVTAVISLLVVVATNDEW